jgi:hypothetical protein
LQGVLPQHHLHHVPHNSVSLVHVVQRFPIRQML